MLRIGIIGYNIDIIKRHVLPLIIKMEKEAGNSCILGGMGKIVTDQDIEYIPIFGIKNILGLLLDQLIIVDDDDEVNNIFYEKSNLIQTAEHCLRRSYIPEEHQVQIIRLYTRMKNSPFNEE